MLGVQHDSSFRIDSNVSCDALRPTGAGGRGWESKVAPGVRAAVRESLHAVNTHAVNSDCMR